MAIVYLIASALPFWAIPLALILLEYANRKRMARKRETFLLPLIFAGILLLSSGAFFYFGGHKNIGPAFRAYREGRLNFMSW